MDALTVYFNTSGDVASTFVYFCCYPHQQLGLIMYFVMNNLTGDDEL